MPANGTGPMAASSEHKTAERSGTRRHWRACIGADAGRGQATVPPVVSCQDTTRRPADGAARLQKRRRAGPRRRARHAAALRRGSLPPKPGCAATELVVDEAALGSDHQSDAPPTARGQSRLRSDRRPGEATGRDDRRVRLRRRTKAQVLAERRQHGVQPCSRPSRSCSRIASSPSTDCAVGLLERRERTARCA